MLARLSNIAEIQLGYQATTRMRPDPAGSHCAIQIKDIGEDGVVDFAGLVRIRPERAPARYEVQEGDVLFIARGNRLRALAVGSPPSPTMAVSFFYILRPDHAVVGSAYLSWAMNQPDVQAQVRRAAMGTGIPHIRRGPVESLRIQVPPLDIQRSILKVQELLAREERLSSQLLARRRELAEFLCRRAAARNESR